MRLSYGEEKWMRPPIATWIFFFSGGCGNAFSPLTLSPVAKKKPERKKVFLFDGFVHSLRSPNEDFLSRKDPQKTGGSF